ncbi:MAG TPA: DUF5655 domain-containing protein [Candidatus Dormibacteraeota bacterium]|nr:DUF5655 domain-containing protein [Candidatus Dormibacteraeota bacterium]
MSKTSAGESPFTYGVHPGVARVQKWISDLRAKTGRTLDEWVELVTQSGPPTEKARREWLKAKYNLGTNSAWWIAERAGGTGLENFDDPEEYLRAAELYVREQYSGPKEKLRPIYDILLKIGKSLGSDVKACPCRTIVPLYRNHVFAQIKPAANTRVDLGLALAKHRGKFPRRLVGTGGLAKKDRITH